MQRVATSPSASTTTAAHMTSCSSRTGRARVALCALPLLCSIARYRGVALLCGTRRMTTTRTMTSATTTAVALTALCMTRRTVSRDVAATAAAAAAATATAGAHNDHTHAVDPHVAATATQPPSTSLPAELCFYDTFPHSEFDLDWELLLEAHRKHGVWLNVPPQLPPQLPGVGPPAVPEVCLPAAQQARLQRQRMAYTPTHAPPPMHTIGRRTLDTTSCGAPLGNVDAAAAAAAAAAATATTEKTATSTTPASSITPPSVMMRPVPVRAAPDAAMPYHCSMCGKAYCQREAAEAHVRQRHGTSLAQSVARAQEEGSEALLLAAATSTTPACVCDGPGPGEVIGVTEVLVDLAHPQGGNDGSSSSNDNNNKTTMPADATARDARNSSATTTTTVAATLAEQRARRRYEHAVLTVPDVGVLDTLLREVWDDVAMTRTDIVKPAALMTAYATKQREAMAAAAAAAPAATTTTTRDDGERDGNEDVGDAARAARHATSVPTLLRRVAEASMQQYDSNNGAMFVPAAVIVEGTADRRDEERERLQQLTGGRATDRTTPEGAAPGVRRRSGGGDGGAAAAMMTVSSTAAAAAAAAASMSAAVAAISTGSGNVASINLSTAMLRAMTRLRARPTSSASSSNSNSSSSNNSAAAAVAMAPAPSAMTVRERSKRFANPFGDSPNAATLELEKEPINPFYDLEQEAEQAAAAAAAATTTTTSDGAAASSTSEGDNKDSRRDDRAARAEAMYATWRARPFACPLCAHQQQLQEEQQQQQQQQKEEDGSEGQRQQADVCSAAAAVPRYRLLDALLDHIDSAHGDVGGGDALSEEQWAQLYAMQRQPAREVARVIATHKQQQQQKQQQEEEQQQQQRRQQLEKRRRSRASSSAVRGDGNDSTDAAALRGDVSTDNSTTANDDDDDDDNALSVAVEPDEVQVHVRAATNCVLIGTVRDVQEGYMDKVHVVQYVVGVAGDADDSAAAAAAATVVSAATQPAKDKASSKDEDMDVMQRHMWDNEELIVVRCSSDLMQSTMQRHAASSATAVAATGTSASSSPLALQHTRRPIRVGMHVYVQGCLCNNRRVDEHSRRAHAYPYVRVTPPMGCIQVL